MMELGGSAKEEEVTSSSPNKARATAKRASEAKLQLTCFELTKSMKWRDTVRETTILELKRKKQKKEPDMVLEQQNISSILQPTQTPLSQGLRYSITHDSWQRNAKSSSKLVLSGLVTLELVQYIAPAHKVVNLLRRQTTLL